MTVVDSEQHEIYAPVKVAHIINSLGIGGAEMTLANLIGANSAGELTELIIALKESPGGTVDLSAVKSEVIVLEFDGFLGAISSFRLLRKIIREFQPDVIQGWMYQGSLFATFTKVLFAKRARLIWNIRHGLDAYPKEPAARKFLIRMLAAISKLTQKIVFNSARCLEQHKSVGFDLGRSIIVENGVRIFEKPKGVNPILSLWPERFRKSQVIGTVARNHVDKGYDLFFKVARTALQEHPDIVFMIVGRDMDYASDVFVRNIPDALREKFIFCGELADPMLALTLFDVYLMTSQREAFPNALVEAMSLGLPCVAVDVGGAEHILSGTGIIAESYSPESVYAALKKVIVLGRREKEEIGLAAKLRVEQSFTLARMAERYRDLYTTLKYDRNY